MFCCSSQSGSSENDDSNNNDQKITMISYICISLVISSDISKILLLGFQPCFTQIFCNFQIMILNVKVKLVCNILTMFKFSMNK